MATPRPRRAFCVALGVFLATAAPLFAADFPRGPGFYFSPYKLIAFFLAYLAWIGVCKWVDEDARALHLPTEKWNGLMLGAGAVAAVFLWATAAFWPMFIAMVLAVFGVTYWYVHTRNQKVEPDKRVLTKKHLRELAQRYLKMKFRKATVKEKKGVPVRFIGRSFNQKNEDPNRVVRAAESKGYKAALEMVYEAVKSRATDIHLEPTREEMTVRFRVDGMLKTVTPFTRPMGDAVVNIFKVLCNMDITEKRKPQDGSFSAQVEDFFCDFRVATAGSVIGEKLVMRILDLSKQINSLPQIGMRDKMRDQIVSIVTQPHGMFICCGPTGAGKSTTLYACLSEIDRMQQNIITIENPVEYQLPGVTQIEVNPKAGKTFASELRSILRQDPDVIMIGEIRDQETAEIACQAANTGHMVFSTVHANDTVTAIGRLLDLQVQPFMIASALSAILGQRLVRLLCPECKVRYKPNPDILRKVNLPADRIKYFYKPPSKNGEKTDDEDEETAGPGCEQCGGTGYYGRTGIFELLVINDKIKEMIRENPNLNAIRQEAVKTGMRFLFEDGLRQVVDGHTSVQELLRVSM